MSSGMPALDAQRSNPTDSKGNTATTPDSEVLRAYQQVQERIERTFSDPRYEPPRLPAVAIELLELARRPDVDVKDVVSLLEKDPVLASQLLRHVRSPLYAGGAEIRSLQRALTHLGLEHIRDVALELTVGARVFRAEHYAEAMDRVSRHSRRTAYLTQVVCRYAAHDASYAFLCGLLHDVGLAAGLIALGDVPRREERPDIAIALPVLFEMHTELGAQVAQSWQLAPEVVHVIRHHHLLVDGQGQVNRLAAVVCLAEHLANELGEGGAIAVPGVHHLPLPQGKSGASHDQTAPHLIALACETLGLDSKKMELIRADAAKLVLNLEAPKDVAGTSPETGTPVPPPTPTAAPREVKRSEGAAGSSPSGFWASVRGFFGSD